jgi:GNAT superfamily N-acetyltransferase
MSERIEVTVRPARQEDKTNVLALVARIWNGEDYIPLVWDDWLSDPSGRLLIGEAEGRVIGLGHLGRISRQDWWLEGIRVAPDYQGRGVGGQLYAALAAEWERIGTGELRYLTHISNTAMHHLSEKFEFCRVAELTWFVADAWVDESVVVGERLAFDPVQPDELSIALDVIRSSAVYTWQHGLMDLSWRWAAISPELLEAGIRENRIVWLPGRTGLLVYLIDREEPHGSPNLDVGLIAAAQAEMPAALRQVRGYAAGRGAPRLGMMVPLGSPEYLELLGRAGFRRYEEQDALVLYAKKHSAPAIDMV